MGSGDLGGEGRAHDDRPAGRSEPVAPDIGPSEERPSYPEPQHLTPNGQEAFQQEVTAYALALGEELDRLAARTVLGGASPEHTVDAVHQARYTLRTKPAFGTSGSRKDADRSFRGALLLTAASIGSHAIPGALDMRWQIVVYLTLVLIGLLGLVDLWRGRRASARHRRTSDDPVWSGVVSMGP